MCLDKVTKTRLQGERTGYKIVIKAKDKIFPYCYYRSNDFKMNEWNDDINTTKIWGGNKNYKSGYHFFRHKNEAIAALKFIHKNTCETVVTDIAHAKVFLESTWGTADIEMCLYKVLARDIRAYGRQYEGKKCYVAGRLFVLEQIKHLPIKFLYAEKY